MTALAREAGGVGVFAHGAVELGGDHHLVAPGKLAHRAAQELFAGAVGVDVGGVEEVDAGLEGLAVQRAAALFVHGPLVRAALRVAVGHAAQAEAGDLQAGLAESCVFHAFSSF
jgi:hypothetical protein